MDTQKNTARKPNFAPATAAPEESKLHFLDYWRIIRIRKTVILAVFLLVVLTTTAVTFILPKTYMSMARISVGKDLTDIQPLLAIQQQGGYDPYFIQTEFEKIRSKPVLGEVIEKLDLNYKWAKKYGAEGRLQTSETYQILLKRIDLRQSRNTSLIEIRAFSDDKKEAAEIANEVAETYKRIRIKKKMQESDDGIEALKAEYATKDQGVKEKQAEVDRLKAEHNISDIGDGYFQTTIEPETVRNIERERIRAEQLYTQYAALLSKLTNMSSSDLRKTLPTVQRDDHLSQLLMDEIKASQEYAVRKNDFGANNPEIIKLKDLLASINTQIEARLQGIIQGLETQMAAAKAQMDANIKAVSDARKLDTEMAAKYRPYFQAKRDLETQQRIRESIYLRILQETVDKALPKSSIVEIVDGAEPDVKPIRPNIPLNIGLGVIVGAIIGVGLAFFIEYLDTSVKTIDDVERALQAPVLGVIPQNVGSLLQEGPDSPHAEAYRVLRTNVMFSRKDGKANTLTVVSGGAGEGKSTTIFNLATIFAQNGQRVLLVDSDLRRPSLHKILNLTNSLGLTNYLLKQNTLEEVVQTTSQENLHFLPSGKLPSSSLGILNSAQMKDFIAKVKERYDFVFFDSPPIMGVSDASIISSEVDMTLLVIQYRKYPQVMTIRAKQMVEKVGGNLLGVVLNNINISQDSYYYYYSGYYYDYYSKQDDDAASSSGKNGERKSTTVASTRGGGVEVKPKY
ncbi:MAG TPA: polysaccharide biosynthesis tyrosine autokinase [Methylomirabilota bacterium]|nr:polysaccharide biosynthesis tyrosine autokinase [Methylomirabilota bacterium]